jgi:exodeoxyribonuclease-1
MKTPTIGHYSFYDYESSGVDHHYDQIYQFACIKTNANLDIIDSSIVNLLAKPRLDVLPHPKAFLTHHIDIDILEKEGIDEIELAKLIQNVFLENENNCISGYNTISFDDEMTRNLMFKNLQQPYEHEFRNGNRRLDVYNLVRMAYAFKPDALVWPEKPNEPGSVSFKLEDLAKANGITHLNAHDALSDVYATISLAKLIKQNAPKLFQHSINLTDKSNLTALLAKKEPFFHCSNFHGKENKYTTLLLPIVMDRANKNKMLCIDLRYAPDELLTLSAEEIKHYLFTKRDILGEKAPTIKVVGVSMNKNPIVVKSNPKMLERYANDFNLNLAEINKNVSKITGNRDLAMRIQTAFSNPQFAPPYDCFESLYSGGFISNKDGQLRSQLARTSPDLQNIGLLVEDLSQLTLKMDDAERQYELAIRAKWTNFYQKIIRGSIPGYNQQELAIWSSYLNKRLVEHDGEMGLTFETFEATMNEAKIEKVLTLEEEQILDKVQSYVNNQKVVFNYIQKLASRALQLKQPSLEREQVMSI